MLGITAWVSMDQRETMFLDVLSLSGTSRISKTSHQVLPFGIRTPGEVAYSSECSLAGRWLNFQSKPAGITAHVFVLTNEVTNPEDLVLANPTK
jgi:hypothetical protein